MTKWPFAGRGSSDTAGAISNAPPVSLHQKGLVTNTPPVTFTPKPGTGVPSQPPPPSAPTPPVKT